MKVSERPMNAESLVDQARRAGERLLVALEEEVRLKREYLKGPPDTNLFQRWKECRRQSKRLEAEYAGALRKMADV